MNNYGLSIIDENGEAHGLPELLDAKRIQNKSNDELEDLARNFRYFDKPKKMIMTELKNRLDDGQKFYGVEYSTSQNKITPVDNDEVKRAFVEKHGWGAVVLKSNNKLKEKFGESILKDLEKITVLEEKQKINWK